MKLTSFIMSVSLQILLYLIKLANPDPPNKHEITCPLYGQYNEYTEYKVETLNLTIVLCINYTFKKLCTEHFLNNITWI